MTELEIIDLGRLLMANALIISLPLLSVGLIIGVLVSIFQAATQINEQTLTIVPKLILVGLTLMFLMPWLVERISTLTLDLMARLPEIAKSN